MGTYFLECHFDLDIDDPLGDLLLSSDEENQKPKSNKALNSAAAPTTNGLSRTTDNKDSIKDKSLVMDSRFGNNKTTSSKSDGNVMTQNHSKPLGKDGVVGTQELKNRETERYRITLFRKCNKSLRGFLCRRLRLKLEFSTNHIITTQGNINVNIVDASSKSFCWIQKNYWKILF